MAHTAVCASRWSMQCSMLFFDSKQLPLGIWTRHIFFSFFVDYNIIFLCQWYSLPCNYLFLHFSRNDCQVKRSERNFSSILIVIYAAAKCGVPMIVEPWIFIYFLRVLFSSAIVMSAGQPGNKLVRILLDVSLDTLMHICDLVHQMCAKCILLYTYVTNKKTIPRQLTCGFYFRVLVIGNNMRIWE